MNKFMKVSFEQFVKGCQNSCWNYYEEILREMYDGIKLPSRAESGSAGYDFFLPGDIKIEPQRTVTIPTGICVQLDDDKFLGLMPRSGIGFKYKIQLSNTFGVIDSSYFFADNEGHIMAKLCNDNYEHKTFELEAGKAFMQGIILPFYTTDDDNAPVVRRIGGFGSSNR